MTTSSTHSPEGKQICIISIKFVVYLYIWWLLTKESCIWKRVESARVIFFFWPGRFSRGVTVLWKLTCYDLRVFQNFQEIPNFSGVFKKAFPQPPCLLFFWNTPLVDRWTFCSRHSDIYPAYYTGLKLLHEPELHGPELPQNKIC